MVDDGYLTMARIMDKELEKWLRVNPYYRNYTGFEQLKEKAAFEAGFMAGFSGRYFNTEEA